MKAQPCPEGAIELYEVRKFVPRGGFAASRLLLLTDDKSKADELAKIQKASVNRRFAVLLPGGRLYLLASVYPIKGVLSLKRPQPPWCSAFVADAALAENLAFDAENGQLDEKLPNHLRRLARRLRLASSAMGGVQNTESIETETVQP